MKPPPARFSDRFLGAWQLYERHVRRKVAGSEFAKALGVSAGLVSQWQIAEAPPPHDRILRIAEVCSVDPGWLAYGSASQAPSPEGYVTAEPEVPDPRGYRMAPVTPVPRPADMDAPAAAPAKKSGRKKAG